MTREEIYAWMDKQIEAAKILDTPLDKDDPFYVCIAGLVGNEEIHVYNIDNLCRELDITYNVESHDSEYIKHYFLYKGYKFYGLIEV